MEFGIGDAVSIITVWSLYRSRQGTEKRGVRGLGVGHFGLGCGSFVA